MFFKINNQLAIGAESYTTRSSWGHKAHLYRVRTPEQDDELIMSDKVRYYNRTWEAYEFQSIMQNLVGKALASRVITPEEAETCYQFIKDYQEPNRFGTLAGIAKMGELLTDTPKQANNWKTKMLKAGLGDDFILPPDWDALSDEEKTARLDGAITILQS